MDNLHDSYRSQIGVDEHQFPTYLGSLSEEISVPSDVDMELLQEAFLEFIGSAGVLAETDNELEVEAEHVNHMLAASAYNLDNIKVAVNHLTSNARLFASFETLVRSTIPLLMNTITPAGTGDIATGNVDTTDAVTDTSTPHTSPAVELDARVPPTAVDAPHDSSDAMNTSSGQVVADTSSVGIEGVLGAAGVAAEATTTHTTSTESSTVTSQSNVAAMAAHGDSGDGPTHDVSVGYQTTSQTEHRDHNIAPDAEDTDAAVPAVAAVAEVSGEIHGGQTEGDANEGHDVTNEDNEVVDAAVTASVDVVVSEGGSDVEKDTNAAAVMDSDAIAPTGHTETPIGQNTRTDASTTAIGMVTAAVDVDGGVDTTSTGADAELDAVMHAAVNTNPAAITGVEAVVELVEAQAEMEVPAQLEAKSETDAEGSVVGNTAEVQKDASDEGGNENNGVHVTGDSDSAMLRVNDVSEADAVLVANDVVEHAGTATAPEHADGVAAAGAEAEAEVEAEVEVEASTEASMAVLNSGVAVEAGVEVPATSADADIHRTSESVGGGSDSNHDHISRDTHDGDAVAHSSNSHGNEHVKVAENHQDCVFGDGEGVSVGEHVGDGTATAPSDARAEGVQSMGIVDSMEGDVYAASAVGHAQSSHEDVERGQHGADGEHGADGRRDEEYNGHGHDGAHIIATEEGGIGVGVGVEGEVGYVDVSMPLPRMSSAAENSNAGALIGETTGVRATPTAVPHTMDSPSTLAPHVHAPYSDMSHTPVQHTHASHAPLHLPSTASPRVPVPTCPPSPPPPALPLTSDVSALHRAITELQTALTREREMRKRKEEAWNLEKTHFEEKIRDLEEKLHDPSVAARVRLAEEESQVLRNQLMMTEDEVSRLHREIGVINGRVEKEKERSVRAQETMGEKMMENERLHERISELEHEKRELLAVQRANLHQVECLEVDLSKKNEQLSHANEDAESLIREMGDVRREVDVWKGKAQERGTALEQACMQYYNSMGIRVRFDWDEEGEWSLASADPVTRLVLGSVMGNTNTPIVGIDDNETGNINTHLSTRAYSSGGDDHAEVAASMGTHAHTHTANAGTGTGMGADDVAMNDEHNVNGMSPTASSAPTTPVASNLITTTTTTTTTTTANAPTAHGNSSGVGTGTGTAAGASTVIPPQTFTVGTHVLSSLLPPPPPSTSSLPLATQAAVSRALFEQKTLFLHFFPFLRLPAFGYSISEASRVMGDQSNTISRLHTAHENELVALHEELETHRQSQTDYSLIIRRLADDAGHSRAAKRAYSLILKRVVVAAFMARVRSRKMAAELYRMVVALLSCLLGCLTAAAHSSSAALPVDLASLQIHTDAQNVSSALSNITHPRTALHKSLTLLSTALALATPAAAALGGVCERQLATIGAFFKRNIALAGRVDSLQGALERLRGGGDGNGSGSGGSGSGVGGSRRRDDVGIAQAIYDTNTHTHGYGSSNGSGAFDGSFDHPAGHAPAPIRARINPPTVLPTPSPTSSTSTGASGYNPGYPGNNSSGSGSGSGSGVGVGVGGGFSGYKGPRTRPPSAYANNGSNGNNNGYGYAHGTGGMGDRYVSGNAATYNNNTGNASMSFTDEERRTQHGYTGTGTGVGTGVGNSRNGANNSFSRTTPIQHTMSGSPVRTRTRPSTASATHSATHPSTASKPVPYNPQLQQNINRSGNNFGNSVNSRNFPDGNSRPQTMADVHAWTQASNSTRDHAIYGESDLSVIVDDDLRNNRRSRPIPTGNNTQTQSYTHTHTSGHGGVDPGMSRKPISPPSHSSHPSPSRPSPSTAVSIPFSHPYALRMSPTQQQGRPAPPPPNGPPAHVRPVTASRNMRPTSSHRRAAPNGSGSGSMNGSGGNASNGNYDGNPNASANGSDLGRLYGLSNADDEATKRGYVNTYAPPPPHTHTTGMEGDRRDMVPKPPPGAAAFIRRMK